MAYVAECDLYSSSSSRNGITSVTDKTLRNDLWFCSAHAPSILERSHVESAMAFRVYYRIFLVQHLNSYMQLVSVEGNITFNIAQLTILSSNI